MLGKDSIIPTSLALFKKFSFEACPGPASNSLSSCLPSAGRTGASPHQAWPLSLITLYVNYYVELASIKYTCIGHSGAEPRIISQLIN